MIPLRRQVAILSTAAILIVSCRRDRKPIPADSAELPPGPAIPAVAPRENTGWEEGEAGPVLFLSIPDSKGMAAVVMPFLSDSTLSHTPVFRLDSLSGMSADLFRRAGSAGSARLVARDQSPNPESCISWPVANLEGVGDRVWRVGLRKGMATPVPLDSLEGASSADSVLFTSELARLASALPESNDAVFRGLPFNVRKAYRTKGGPMGLLIGDVVRKINEEANPREEHFLIVAERSSGADGRYTAVFHSRAAGSEEVVRTNEILAVVRFVNGGNTAVIVSFEYENGGRLALIEQTSEKVWKTSWRSAYTGC